MGEYIAFDSHKRYAWWILNPGPLYSGTSGEVMSESRIFIYRYLDDDKEDEEADLTGQIEMPRTGDIIYRKEKIWKVTGVYAVPLTDQIPHFRIHLLDISKPEFVN